MHAIGRQELTGNAQLLPRPRSGLLFARLTYDNRPHKGYRHLITRLLPVRFFCATNRERRDDCLVSIWDTRLPRLRYALD